MRGCLHLGHQGRAGGHRQAGTVRRRLEAGAGTCRRGAAAPQRPSGSCGRQRPGRAGMRERLGQDGLRGEDFRGAAQGGRGAGLRHSGVPPAERADRGARNRRGAATGRGDRDRRDRGAYPDGRCAARRGGVRRRVHRFGRRTAALHGHSGREPERRGLGQRISDARQPDACL